MVWEGEGERILIEAYGKDCIRFRGSPNIQILDNNWTLLAPTDASPDIERVEDKAIMTNGKIRCILKEDGSVCYTNSDNKILLEEFWKDRRVGLPPIRRAREYKYHSGSSLFDAKIYFKANHEEKLYGMGQHADDCFNIKGCTLELAQKNTQTSIPYVISSLGYGFVWNNPAIGRVEFARNQTLWHAEATRQVDYLVFAQDSPAEIQKIFCRLYGKPTIPQVCAIGYWQSKLRYETQKELLEKVREHVIKRKLPMDVVVVDFFHWTQHGEWKFDPECWPNPREMVAQLEDMGVKLAVSIWPTVDQRSENYKYMKEHNLLMRTDRNQQVVKMSNGPLIYYDTTNEKARKFVWSKVKENYYDNNIRVFWLDEAEPGMIPYDYDNVRYSIGSALEVGNIYPYYYAKGFYEGLIEAGCENPTNLVRSAWLGSQKYGVILWSGDIPSTFESLRYQIKIGLSIAFSGISLWTTDIGGFFGGDGRDPEFVELLIRWFQFGAFCPVFRMHGNRYPYSQRPHGMTDYTPTSGENQVWSYGEEAYEIMVKYLHLREKMKPYIWKHVLKANADGTPIMRPLFYDFPTDKKTWDIEDEYMFGDSILVAPIYYYQARERSVYLPQGVDWVNANTGELFEGGRTINVEADIRTIPYFFKNGFALTDIENKVN